jgi:uncharacterized protein YjiK
MKRLLSFTFLISILLASCDSGTTVTSQLELLATYSIEVSEPSGLAINSSGNILYTVSDNTNKVYKLSTSGLVLQTFGFTGDDLEGICSFTNEKVLIAEERTKNIIELNTVSGIFTTHHMDYDNNELNAGIEGITYNPNTQSIYFVNEKNPDRLFKLDPNFNIISSYDLDFANDYSGIFYDEIANLLWIVSDESQTINKCTLEGELIESYIINVQKPEGIVIANDKIYIVSDSQERLYTFQKPN